jgi:1-acyl-sn-glycerol-3-phosphate acyltransferase
MKQSLCKGILRACGWTIGPKGDDVPKCVICVAPHTSNLDFTIGKLFYNAIGRKAKFLIKKEWFVFPLNIIFKSMGGIPINRSKSSSSTKQLAEEFAKRETFHLAITPEGTRKQAKEWKKGFYYIALKAGVPIQVAYLDYGKKEAGIKATFYPTDDADADIATIRSMYCGIKGHHEDNFIELK